MSPASPILAGGFFTTGATWDVYYSFPVGSVVNNPPTNEGDTGSIPGSGRSPGGGHGNPLQYSCLENPMNRGAWQATVAHQVPLQRSQTAGHNLVHTHIYVNSISIKNFKISFKGTYYLKEVQ